MSANLSVFMTNPANVSRAAGNASRRTAPAGKIATTAERLIAARFKRVGEELRA